VTELSVTEPTPPASNARVRALAIDDLTHQGLLIIFGAATVERFVERSAG